MADGGRHPLVALGYLGLGIGLTIEAVRSLMAKRSPAAIDVAQPVGRFAGAESEAMGRAERVITRAPVYKVKNIDERVSYIQGLIRRGSLDPRVIEQSRAVLTRKCGGTWCVPEKDYAKEIVAMFHAVQDARSPIALRYTRDHAEVDQFMSAAKLLRIHAGDCDDGAVLLGSLLRSVGYPVKLRVIHVKGEPSWSHIYLLIGVSPQHPSKWIPLDWSVKRPPGWQAPGAEESARTDKPAGVVVRVRDFEV